MRPIIHQKLSWLLVGLTLVAVALAWPTRVLAAPPSPLTPGSENAAKLAQMFYLVLAIAAGVFVLVEGLLIFAVVRYRRRPSDDPDRMPPQIHGNAALELVWTIIPAGILVGLFVMVLPTLRAQREAPADAFVVEVIGHQWYWEFHYPDADISLLNEVYLPVGRPILLEITSQDVIHSFWVPELSGKKDAIPGHTTTLWFEIARPATYRGQCAEFCGLEHYAMLFDVNALDRAEFEDWLAAEIEAQKVAKIGTDLETPLPAGDPANGAILFTEQGCTACHSLDGTRLVGPSLQGIGQRAASRKAGYEAELYVRESILLPCEVVVEGFTCVMPQDFGERLTAQNLADLIAYLLEQ